MTMSMKDQFDTNGYVVLKQLFSEEEVRKLKKAAASIISHAEVRKAGVFVGLAYTSELFKQAAAKPELTQVLQKIIGDHVIFLSDKLVFKNLDTSFNSPWHQDYPYWKGSHKYSVWIALDDATVENGCLQILPGSHHLGILDHDGDASDGMGFKNRIETSMIDQAEIVDLVAD